MYLYKEIPSFVCYILNTSIFKKNCFLFEKKNETTLIFFNGFIWWFWWVKTPPINQAWWQAPILSAPGS